MKFNSFDYLFFFLAVVAVYFALPFRLRRAWLLGASLFFYMYWSPVFVLLIFYTTTIDYFVTLRLAHVHARGARRGLLAMSYVSNFGALFLFKYYNFFMDSWGAVASRLGLAFHAPLLHVILPVGISFYTFEAISYTTDVYHGKYPAERSYPRLLLFILFFPKLIAGPIERAWHLIPQFERRSVFEYARVREGLAKILWGLTKKLVVADRLGIFVDAVYNHVGRHSGASYLVATVFFAFQIYCDFSAYSDIAIGSSQIMGFELLRNFRRPYFATSIGDFWHRWHVSLSTWFRDYVYIPLGGNRDGFWRMNQNLFTVFLVSGIWHGARWTFVLWGLYHGVFLLAETVWKRFVPAVKPSAPLRRVLQTAATFPIACLSWVLFRANSVHDAVQVYAGMFGDFGARRFLAENAGTGNFRHLAYGACGIALVLGVELATECGLYRRLWTPAMKPVRWLAYAGLATLIVLIGVFDGGQFIYFQF
jgi:D-alanyl-lipoteichoic acid acyltransferase DltB (MBOAT superfamily)